MLILSGAGGNLPESGSRCPQRSGECVRELQTSARRQTGTLPEKTEKAWNRLIPGLSWRRRWDSNPRALADNLISSQARYDHFDTAPIKGKYQFTTSAEKTQVGNLKERAAEGKSLRQPSAQSSRTNSWMGLRSSCRREGWAPSAG